MKPVRFILPAEQEMLDAAMYYESKAHMLGEDFLDRVDAAVSDIVENPQRWPIVRFNVRRRLVRRYPFAVLYRVVENEIVILAVMHQKRHPSYWFKRV
jgi:plasmid stabilization system protein ParE